MRNTSALKQAPKPQAAFIDNRSEDSMNYPRMPRKRLEPRKKKKTTEEADRQLDRALEETFPTSDPVAITTPGGPVKPDEDPTDKKSGQKPTEEPRKQDR
jgi:hypothetical protein